MAGRAEAAGRGRRGGAGAQRRPAEISDNADVFVLHGAEYVKVKNGTNGCACLVARDLHEASRYPICYDRVAATTWLKREIMEVELRARGVSESEVKRRVDAAYARGELSWPAGPALAYMMSREQVLSPPRTPRVFASARGGRNVMIILPAVTHAQLGLTRPSKVQDMQLNPRDAHHGELIVKVPNWSGGKPVAPRLR